MSSIGNFSFCCFNYLFPLSNYNLQKFLISFINNFPHRLISTLLGTVDDPLSKHRDSWGHTKKYVWKIRTNQKNREKQESE